MSAALGVIEILGLTPSMVALDALEKSAEVTVLQTELNDYYGVCAKIQGPVAAVRTAIAAGQGIAEEMGASVTSHVLGRVNERALQAILSPREFNPLIQQDVVFEPDAGAGREDETVSQESNLALGFIETQGFTAVFAAIDTACKAASVEIVGKEKLGGGYVTVVVKGDVASVKAAIEAGKTEVEALGKLSAAHVIPRPSPSVLALLPRIVTPE
ncbi:MAG: BMC domain-containing protein [Isosphaeraceae bacterium]